MQDDALRATSAADRDALGTSIFELASSEEQPIGRSLVATMRLVLAASALGIIIIDPSEPDRLVAVTYAVLALYTIYSAAVYRCALAGGNRFAPLFNVAHWIDVGWYTVLVALSNGTNSLFFFGYLFATLIAAFRFGMASGVRVSVASATLFACVGFAAREAPGSFELNRFVLRPIFLVVLGYMMASFGSFQITLRRRLRLLKEVSAISNPRFGVDYTIMRILERVRDFYHADDCVLVTPEGTGGEAVLRRARRSGVNGTGGEGLPVGVGERLLALPENGGVIFRTSRSRFKRSHVTGRSVTTGAGLQVARSTCERIAAIFDAEHVLTVPVVRHEAVVGRLYVISPAQRCYPSDIDLLMHMIHQVAPVIDNIRLVDQLASNAAQSERLRIARDIHDSVIQSYIGIQLALNGVAQRSAAGFPVGAELGRVEDLVHREIADARNLVSGLERPSAVASVLPEALRRFAGKFSAATGIEVHLDVPPHLAVSDRLAAEVFHIVEEALSNVRRHTMAPIATVRIRQAADRVRIAVENPLTQEAPALTFTPRSIVTRANALGGRVIVECRSGSPTMVTIDIPL